MKQVALGFRVHSGWTALVAIALDESGCPHVIFRERPHLVKDFTYEYRQPYHTAKKRSSAEALDFVLRVRSEARILASNAISSVQSSFGFQGNELQRCALLLASGRPLPDLPRILASHALIHAADGELFREAVLHATKRCGMEIFTIKESELFDGASRTLHLKVDELGQHLVHLGATIGPPWTQDEKLAALVAWLSLAGSSHASRVAKSR